MIHANAAIVENQVNEIIKDWKSREDKDKTSCAPPDQQPCPFVCPGQSLQWAPVQLHYIHGLSCMNMHSSCGARVRLRTCERMHAGQDARECVRVRTCTRGCAVSQLV